MIVRDIQIRFRDSTTDSLQAYNNERLILAPLLDYEIEIVERICVVIEPQTGSMDQPDPNGFVSVLPAAWAPGNQFAITLLSQDWENEGFAAGDEVFLFIKRGFAYITVRATIRQINSNSATFTIIQANAGGPPDFQQPVEVVALLLDDPPQLQPRLHHGSGSGTTSPLSGLAFTTPHADAFDISAVPSSTLPAMIYNLLKYSIYESDIDTAFPGLQPRRFREYTYKVKGTQFYAYRTNLDPTIQAPITLYNLNGYLEIIVQKRSLYRDLQQTFNCLLLHPNRLEDTLTFLQPGTLTISGNSGTVTPPAGFSPQRTRIALLGSDAHHSALTIANSLELTSPTQPPLLPPGRAGASYVGVMVGQSSGKWVAVMTNKVESIASQPGVFSVFLPQEAFVYRYDAFLAVLERHLQAGAYTIQTLIKYQNNFYVIDEIDYDTQTPRAPFGIQALQSFISNMLPIGHLLITNILMIERIDLFEGKDEISDLIFTLFFLPIPSRRQSPTIPFATTQPASGLLYNLAQWAGGQLVLKWRCFAPDGGVYDSPEVDFTQLPDVQPQPDTSPVGTFNETASQITYSKSPGDLPFGTDFLSIIRIALFRKPEGYRPLHQSIMQVIENNPPTIFQEIDPVIQINHIQVFGFDAIIDKTSLRPGDYSLHFRLSFRRIVTGSTYDPLADYSFFYDFTIPAPPPPPPAAPLPDTGLCPHRTPALAGEGWQYLYKDEQLNWQYSDTNLTGCSLENYCTCFEIVPEIPRAFVDILGFFRGSVQGKPVPAGAKHKSRFVGVIKRIADEVESESFVSSQYKQEDIIRAFRERYEIELLIMTPCELSHIDLLKYAEKLEIVNRSNKLLPQILSDLVITEVSIDNENTHLRARLSLRTLHWRTEYRRQG